MKEGSPYHEGETPCEDPRRSGTHGTGGGAAWEEGVGPVINVPPKIITVAAKERPAGPAPGPGAAPEDSHAEQKSMEWKRKAGGRRLRARDAAVAADYQPEFTTLRMTDYWTPEFDQPQPDTAPNAGATRGRYFDMRWSLLLVAGGMLAALLAVSTMVVLWYRKDIEEITKTAAPKPEDLPGAVQQKAVQATLETVHDIKQLVTRFFAARTPEEKVSIVRGGDALLPAMQAYYASRPDEPSEIRFTGSVKAIHDEGREFFFVNGTDAYRMPFEVVIERTPDGMRMDWRYFTGSGEMEWAQWLKDRPRVPVRLRAVASPDNYYAGAFANADDWICVKVTDIGGSATAWAYAKRTSDTAAALAASFAGRHTGIRLQGLFEFPAEDARTAPSASITQQIFLRYVDDRGWLDRSPELGYPETHNHPPENESQ